MRGVDIGMSWKVKHWQRCPNEVAHRIETKLRVQMTREGMTMTEKTETSEAKVGGTEGVQRCVMPDFSSQRQAAAWLIRTGRMIVRSNVPIAPYISRRDNNKNFEIGFHLIECGRRVAIGYQFENFTDEMYRAHLRATRKA